jgi:hypothetical protein
LENYLENYFGQLSAQQTKKYIAATSGVDDELSTIFALGAKLISNVTYPPHVIPPPVIKRAQRRAGHDYQQFVKRHPVQRDSTHNQGIIIGANFVMFLFLQ